MTPSAAQLALDFPAAPVTPRRRRTPARRVLSAQEPPSQPLTPDTAAVEARRVLASAGLAGQVSRVVVWPTSDRPGWLSTVALLRPGADPQAMADALAVLPGGEVRVGVASVSVYRRVIDGVGGVA